MTKHILFALIFGFSPLISTAQSSGFEVLKNLEIMSQVYEHLDLYFVDEPQPATLSKRAIDAMLKELDPYTIYYHESNIEDYRLLTTGQYGGIGALIRQIGDYTYIAEPYEGNPAQKNGLRAGDKILSIDGKSMAKKPSDDVSSALKGPKGTTIAVEIERFGEGVKTISITRDEIKLPDVPYFGVLDKKIGYIKLNGFTQTASADVYSAMQKLESDGMEELVLDLRGNGGGLLIEAAKIVNFFVPKNQVVVTTKGRIKDENRIYNTLTDPVAPNIPLTVLIDAGSASASEIVAGSLQDMDRAVIVGETSFGKGLVQRTYDLKYGSKLKVTIAKYYTPSGRCVQRLEYYDKETGSNPKEIADSLLKTFKTKNGRVVKDGRGIEPDVKVELPELSKLSVQMITKDLIFNYATEFASQNKSIAKAGKFKLSDVEYTAFKQYVMKQDFDYTTTSEEQLKKIKTSAEKEGYFKDIESEYQAMLTKLTPSKERDLDKFQEEIRQILENEIVSRYYYQNGRTVDSFKNDPILQKAKEVLMDHSLYQKILNAP